MNLLELEYEMAYRDEQRKKASGSGRRVFAVGKLSRARSGVIVWIMTLLGGAS